jgi:hypothetical protein
VPVAPPTLLPLLAPSFGSDGKSEVPLEHPNKSSPATAISAYNPMRCAFKFCRLIRDSVHVSFRSDNAGKRNRHFGACQRGSHHRLIRAPIVPNERWEVNATTPIYARIRTINLPGKTDITMWKVDNSGQTA